MYDTIQNNTEYTNFKTTDKEIQWFWSVLRSFSREDLALFLQYVTGTSKVRYESSSKDRSSLATKDRFRRPVFHGAASIRGPIACCSGALWEPGREPSMLGVARLWPRAGVRIGRACRVQYCFRNAVSHEQGAVITLWAS